MRSEFEPLFLKPTRWIDVRAPVEFLAGSVPGAVNLPLLNDGERHQIGITFKEKGQQAAIELGQRLVSGEIRDERIKEWLRHTANDPGAVIYCFRGGLRSKTVQAWIQERGTDRPVIAGGYKALRRFFLAIFEERIRDMRFEAVHGPTGSGKTAFLRSSGRAFLDLEALAAHRGSAFGAMERPQPKQADFENALAVELLRLSMLGETILVEGESRLIGHCCVPEPLFQKLKSCPRMYVEVAFEKRVDNILREYVVTPLESRNPTQVFDQFRGAVIAISRRLGGLRTQEILADLNLSQTQFQEGMGVESNRVWIGKLLSWYYDPAYRFSFGQVISRSDGNAGPGIDR